MKLHTLALPELIDYWDTIDDKGRNLAAIRALVLEDRYYLLVKVMRRKDMLHPWIYERCREVEKSPDGHLDLWAREHYKSTIITFGGIIQEILLNPEITIGIFSHTSSIAKGFLAQIKREFELNSVLKAAFPDILYANPQGESKCWSIDNGIVVKRNSNPKEATVEASGLVDGQPISKHYALRVYDDVVTDKSVSTPEQSHKTTDAYSLSQSLGQIGGREWGIGTRYNYADTYQWIIERGALIPRIYAATDNGQKEGKPVYFTQEEWDKRQIKHTDSDIACQYLQDPLSGTEKMFHVDDLRVYEVRPHTLNAYLMVDPARSKKKDSANTAMVIIGMDAAGNKYLLDGYNHRMDLMERWTFMRDLYYKWVRAPGIQSVKAGYESFGAQADMDYFNERMRVEKHSFPINELAWPREGEGSKTDRVQRLGPDFRAHKFFLPHATTESTMTKMQKQMMDTGVGYRVSKSIRRKDSDGNIYDLSEQFKVQVHYFPFGGLKDLVDAASRIYDIEPTPPIMINESSLEPEFM